MKHRALVAVGAALSLALAACGDDESDSATDATDAATVTTTADAPATTAAGAATTAAGADTTAASADTTAAGADTTAAGADTTAAGADTTAAGADTTAAGADTTAAGAATTAAGADTTEAGAATTAAGADTTEAGGDTTAATGATTAGTTAGTASSGSMAPVTPGPDWPDKLVFTLTPSQEAGGLIETAQPLADMLSERLGGIEVEALVPTDYAGVIVALESGQAQIAGGLGPNQMVQAEEQADADLILQAERFGSLTYVTQWFTNDPDTFCSDEPAPAGDDGFLFCNGVGDAQTAEDGPIGEDELANVEGKTVAFVDQGSTSGYLVPALQLLNNGVDPTTGISPLFAGGHDSAVQAVYDGDADVGVSFNDARGQLVDQVPDVGEKVVVFAWSGPIPNDGFAVAGDLPEDLKQAITDAFVDISASEEGATLLDELYEIDGLAPVNSADYDVIRELNTELADLME